MQLSKNELLAKCNAASKNTLMETLMIEYIDLGMDAGNEFLKACMPVTPMVHQPDGVLHGGASVALAESVGSLLGLLFTDMEQQQIRGLEISANHLKSIKSGVVIATARFIHKGRTTQLIEIKITDSKDNLISLSKLTTIKIDKRS